ncbi:hypothetical protein COV19_01705 [Candidatus Woesearchaeota archaeon CG10_big_fil_rev_8_21_14_0_10_44_13]|nr:MAG: hypothetical protein COV19_01705 [Candidatus Woesearchaeota archaeon CG10_big_fil_rev_8_21_14_0_10_44_13]
MVYGLRESDKHFLWSLIGAIGIILFWRGIWGGIDILPSPLDRPELSFFLGLAILTFSGLIFKEFDPLGGLEKGVIDVLHMIQSHPEKKDYMITYHDKLNKKDVNIRADDIKQFEKSMLLIHEGGKEIFIPLHRIKSIHKKGEVIWRM